MNYIKLHLGGKDRGAKIGLGFLQRLQEALNMNLSEINEKAQAEALTFIPTVLFHSLAFNAERSGEKVDFDVYDVLDWCSDVGLLTEDGEVLKFWNAFNESITKQIPQKLIDKEIEEGKNQPEGKPALTVSNGRKK